MFDTDNDGTVDLAEAKKAASALFDKLDRDHDGTLDKRELAGRLTPKEFAAAVRRLRRLHWCGMLSNAIQLAAIVASIPYIAVAP